MQNEFEKQVQQKMEELNFTTSEPVWLNIEKQIRNKKYKMNNVIAGRNRYQKEQSINIKLTKNIEKQEAVVATDSNNFLRQIDIESNNPHERTIFPLIHFERINPRPLTNLQREDIVKVN